MSRGCLPARCRAGQLPGGGSRRLLERPGGDAGRRDRPLPRGRGQPPDRSHTQFGSIENLSGLIPVDATTLIFYGEVGPNPFLPGNPKVHVIDTGDGQIFCTWTDVFTLKVVDAAGTAVFSGDGEFTITGGTGKFQGATGRFTTLFETQPVPPGADRAFADYEQFGEIRRH